MKIAHLCWIAVVASLGAAPSDDLDPSLAPDILEGSVWAAECVATPEAKQDCSGPALQAGKPGGLLDGERFTVLLIDGSILARTCAAGSAGGRLRAAGIHHRDGDAMSVFRLEEDCGNGWRVVDLPHSGVSAGGAAGGDE